MLDRITSDQAILGGKPIIRGNSKAEMTHELARYVLTLGFNRAEQTRMEDLATRNQEGKLSSEDHQELMNYVRAGHLLALLHSQARRSLKVGRSLGGWGVERDCTKSGGTP